MIQLKGALSDLKRLGMSFQDIETQSNVGLDFLIDAFKRCDMVVPEGAIRRKSLERPSTSSIIKTPPISAQNISSTPSTAEIIQPKSLSIPSKPTSIAVNVDKRSSLPSSPDINSSRSAKRKFGHDRWSQSLKLELSDDSDDDGKQRIKVVKTVDAKTELLAKKREIERMKQLLKEAELAKLATAPVDSSIVSQYNEFDKKEAVSSKDGSADDLNDYDNVSPYEQIISTVNEALGVLLEEKKRLDGQISDLNSSLKSSDLHTLEEEVDQLNRALESKRKLVVEATIRATKVEAQLEAANESSARIFKSIQGYEQKLSDLKRKNDDFLRKSSSPTIAASGSETFGHSDGRNSVPSGSLEIATGSSLVKAPERLRINIDGSAVVLKAYDSDSSLASSAAYHTLLDPDTEKLTNLDRDNRDGSRERKGVVEALTKGHNTTLAQPYPAEHSDSSVNDKNESVDADDHLAGNAFNEGQANESENRESLPFNGEAHENQDSESRALENSEDHHNSAEPTGLESIDTDTAAVEKLTSINDAKSVENEGDILENSAVESSGHPGAKLV